MQTARAFSLLAATALMAAPALGAESGKLKCEEWHPRLGQNPDKLVAIDFDAKKCNGAPCLISAAEFKWKEQNDRYEFVVNRLTGEGSMAYQGEVLFLYKSCKLEARS